MFTKPTYGMEKANEVVIYNGHGLRSHNVEYKRSIKSSYGIKNVYQTNIWNGKGLGSHHMEWKMITNYLSTDSN